MRSAIEDLLGGRLTPEQYREKLILKVKHDEENRASARDAHRLVDKPEDLPSEHPLMWKQHFGYGGVKWAYGYEPDKEQHTPLQLAYWCGNCNGWIKGEPYEESYDTIGFMSGSRGTRLFCGICSDKIGETISEMS